MNLKTRELLRTMLSSEIHYLLSKAGDPATPPQEAAKQTDRLEKAASALVDLLRDGETHTNVQTTLQSFALETVQRGASALDEINTIFETGSGKNGPAHRFIKALSNIAKQDPNTVEVLKEIA